MLTPENSHRYSWMESLSLPFYRIPVISQSNSSHALYHASTARPSCSNQRDRSEWQNASMGILEAMRWCDVSITPILESLQDGPTKSSGSLEGWMLDVGFWRFGPSSSYQILGVRGSGWDWGGEREREENKSSSMRFVNQIFWRSSETKEASISSRRVDFLSNALGTCRLHHRAVWQTGSSFHRAWQSKPKITPDGSTDDDDDFTALDCRLYRQARLKRREMLA